MTRTGWNTCTAPALALRDLEAHLNGIFAQSDQPRAWRTAVDIEETDQTYVITAELPGMKREALQISAEDNTVTVKGSCKREAGEVKQNAGRATSSGPYISTVDTTPRPWPPPTPTAS